MTPMPMPLPPSPHSPGLAYWVATLRPWAQAGYRHGTVNAEAILLRNEATGYEVLRPRPSAGWFPCVARRASTRA
jgi:hypothetical protein